MGYAQLYIDTQKKVRPKENPKRFYSDLFQEYFTVGEGGIVTFESGAVYTRREMDKIKGKDKEFLQGIHLLKLKFKGEIIGEVKKK